MNGEEGNESDVASEAHTFEHDHQVMDRKVISREADIGAPRLRLLSRTWVDYLCIYTRTPSQHWGAARRDACFPGPWE
jgi:hypothetical protein